MNTELFKVVLDGIPISEEQCMGDSLPIINAAFLSLSASANRPNGLYGDVVNYADSSTLTTAGDFLLININGVQRKIRLWD